MIQCHKRRCRFWIFLHKSHLYSIYMHKILFLQPLKTSFYKLLFFRLLKKAKIQAIYFKIRAIYFEIYGSYFLQSALCFFQEALTVNSRSIVMQNFLHKICSWFNPIARKRNACFYTRAQFPSFFLQPSSHQTRSLS